MGRAGPREKAGAKAAAEAAIANPLLDEAFIGGAKGVLVSIHAAAHDASRGRDPHPRRQSMPTPTSSSRPFDRGPSKESSGYRS
ncbi:hypothetical protein AB4144_51270, partial [Rhizobiaceae sp. 2RAB30]